MLNFPYIWTWKTRLPKRRGQLFRVLHRGTLNSCLIEFQDGHRTVTSRNALRKAVLPGGGNAPARQARECTCTYQKERTWGYALFDWCPTRSKWIPISPFLTPADVARFADHSLLTTILIKCNGCGAEPLREKP